MMRVSALGGRAVVDLDAAEKLGRIEKVILDPDGRQVAGFVVSRGSSLFGTGTDTVLPASAVHAIGPDAVTVRAVGAAAADVRELDELPRVSDMVGRKVVSEAGRFLGTVDDVLVDETDGRIVGYALTGDGAAGKLSDLVSGDRNDRPASPYLRADANLRAGKDLIVAPEDAISHDWAVLGREISDDASVPPAPAKAWTTMTVGNVPVGQWRRDREPGAVPLAPLRTGDDL